MIEHRLIEKFLVAVAKSSNRMSRDACDPVLIDTIVDFIRTYADRTHHGKEEDILFRELLKKRITGDHLAAMNELIEEHKQARAKVRLVTELNERYRKGDRSVVPAIKETLQWLVDFYPVHIQKEDKSFFKATERYFGEGELEDMLREFWDFDKTMIHEKYRKVLEQISK
jgi:hemerythrin-like domain-containing protein